MKIQISIFKNTYKKEPKEPDYRISMVGAHGGFQKAGAGWIKETKTGDKYVSATIDTEYETPSMIKQDIPTLTPEEKAQLNKVRNAEDVFNNF